MNKNKIFNLIKIAREGIGGSRLLKNGRLVNVLSGEIHLTNILIKNGIIVGVGASYNTADRVYDLEGRYILPGLVDGHLHIESSLLNLGELTKLLLKHGTTTIIIDPHEIANVLGTKGIEYILKSSEDLPLDIFVMAPSCVPATNLETSGARIGVPEIKKLFRNPRVIGLGEVMNFPGVIFGDKDLLGKIKVAQDLNKVIDGHSPGLSGNNLQGYILVGIGSDHETTRKEEAKEKLRLGMRVMIREGSAAKNLSALLPIVNPVNARRIIFVSDDLHPEDLLTNGHIDAILRKAVASGLDPILAIQMVTLNPCEYFGLKNLGAIAPGYDADITIVDDLINFKVRMVIKKGNIVVENGRIIPQLKYKKNRIVFKTMRVRPFTVKDLKIPQKDERVRVIRLIPNQIVTEEWITTPKIEKGVIVPDIERDILKLVVIERHKRTGNIGLGLVSGFGIKKGAIGSSVSHDAHNIIIVGTNDRDIYRTAQEIIRLEGGLVMVAQNKVIGALPLPIAGLISEEPVEKVVERLKFLLQKTKDWGSRLPNSFIALSFLALPVIPELKLTDKGLIDVRKFEIVPLWA